MRVMSRRIALVHAQGTVVISPNFDLGQTPSTCEYALSRPSATERERRPLASAPCFLRLPPATRSS